MQSGNSIGVNGVTARAVVDRKSGEMHRRLLSAAVLAAPALAAVYWGGLYYPLLILAFALVMAWEWDRLCGEGAFGLSGAALMLVAAAVVYMAATGHHLVALAVNLCGALFVFAVARLAGRPNPTWVALGALYIGVPVLALVWLRGDGAFGRDVVLWLFAVVWATEIGAYACGRLIGGPRLTPRISPKKTWAGAVGGILAAVLVSAAAAEVAAAEPKGLLLFAVLVSGAAQGGDLLESAVKRHFGVKDMSRVIPGHGGVFDRVDGVLIAAPVTAALVWLAGGGIASWR